MTGEESCSASGKNWCCQVGGKSPKTGEKPVAYSGCEARFAALAAMLPHLLIESAAWKRAWRALGKSVIVAPTAATCDAGKALAR